jgi:OmpA-OmpF porin, OOP family
MKHISAIVCSIFLLSIFLFIKPVGAFEIITADDLKENVVVKTQLIRTADNFIILYDASGSMADAYKPGVMKIEAENQILKQQLAILPDLGYQAGLYLFTPFKVYYKMQAFNKDGFLKAINQLPNAKTFNKKSGQSTPLAEAIKALDPILAKLSGTTVVFIFTDGTYTYNKVTKQRPLDAAQSIVKKYNPCFYLISSATTPEAQKLLADIAALNECSRVIPFDALYNNPVWGAGPLYVVNSTKEVQTITNKKIVGAKASDVLFAFDQENILQSDQDNLNKVAKFLQDNPKAYAVLGGFTDNYGDKEYNYRLSKRRVESVKKYILSQANIASDRIVTHWYGATNFVAPNDTDEGRQKNRRVEIAIGLKD